MKLYKATVEHTFVIADYNDSSCKSIEKDMSNILLIHQNDLIREGYTNCVVEAITDTGGLPDGWWTGALPYTKYHSNLMPADLLNVTVGQILEADKKAEKPKTDLETFLLEKLAAALKEYNGTH